MDHQQLPSLDSLLQLLPSLLATQQGAQQQSQDSAASLKALGVAIEHLAEAIQAHAAALRASRLS